MGRIIPHLLEWKLVVLNYKFIEENFRRHDHVKWIHAHALQIGITWSYG